MCTSSCGRLALGFGIGKQRWDFNAGGTLKTAGCKHTMLDRGHGHQHSVWPTMLPGSVLVPLPCHPQHESIVCLHLLALGLCAFLLEKSHPPCPILSTWQYPFIVGSPTPLPHAPRVTAPRHIPAVGFRVCVCQFQIMTRTT
jgi:hypothetical protein